jgi:hypothetical protein
MTVYILFWEMADEWGIINIFSTKKQAEARKQALAERDRERCFIEPWVIDGPDGDTFSTCLQLKPEEAADGSV